MNTLLDWLFGFDPGTFGGDDSGIGFVTPISAWVWVTALLIAALLVWLSYRGLSGPRWARVALGSVRCAILIALIALALGPQIERRRTLIEPDRVIVLLDQSGSMGLPELAADGSRTTRAEILSDLLGSASTIFAEIREESEIDVYTFTDRPTSVAGAPAIDPDAISPSSSTAISRSIQSAMSSAGTNPVSGIVVFSDGRSHDTPSQTMIETLLGSGIPIFTVPIGSSEPVHDASIRQIQAPQAVFAKDRVPVNITADLNGYSAGDEVLVELIDQATGLTLSSTTERIADSTTIETNLSHTFTDPGTKDLIVRLTPRADSIDLASENNEQPIELSVVSEPMRVLYIDGHPRWEYRYLKNLLLREDTINATTMLLASDRRFIEEGQAMPGPIPESLEDWEPYDVVILGDLRPELFSQTQLSSLKEHIETRGCGLLWIAGEGATPSAWTDTQLGSLLPMQKGKGTSVSAASTKPEPVVMLLTEQAKRAGLLTGDQDQIDLPSTDFASVSNPDAGWTLLRWTHAIGLDDLKPGIATLALAQQVDGTSDSALVTSMRYGGGQVGYVGTDEIWRWRYGRGDELPERFWLPMIRTLARGTIARRASPAGLTIAPNRIVPGSDVRATLELFDSAIIDELPSSIDATLTPLSTSEIGTQLKLTGQGQSRSTLWTPNEPGVYALSIAHPLLGSDPITSTIRVHASWDESTKPDTDHAALELLSERTGGQVLDPSELGTLPDILPNRTRITTLSPQTTALWDRPIVLILMVLLLSIEWIGRRTLRLA